MNLKDTQFQFQISICAVKVYFISGLAASGKIFRNIKLPQHCEAVYLEWIPPEKNESLSHYALRLAEKIEPNETFALVGLSFGGMLAVEIAKTLHPSCLILISTVPSIQHLPVYYKWAGAMKLHKVIPVSFVQYASLIKRYFTSETKEDKKMLRSMISKSDAHFIRWAMNAVLTWKNKEVPQNMLHIHGTKDGILPKRFTKPTHVIQKGGHLMILTSANEINKIFTEVFQKE